MISDLCRRGREGVAAALPALAWASSSAKSWAKVNPESPIAPTRTKSRRDKPLHSRRDPRGPSSVNMEGFLFGGPDGRHAPLGRASPAWPAFDARVEAVAWRSTRLWRQFTGSESRW
jgi:hypothetical protein